MPITREKAMYFWHRHLEGADPEARTLRKWNGAFGSANPTTLDEIVGFIADMEATKSRLNVGDGVAMQLLCGEVEEKDLVPTKTVLKLAPKGRKIKEE